MTIESVTEMWSRKTSAITSEDGQNFSAEYTTAFQVVHSIDAGANEIKLASGIPRIRDQYPSTPGCFVTNVEIVETRPIMSIVSVRYFGKVGPAVTDDPVNQEPSIRYYSVTTREPKDTDAFGLPYTNVNGEILEGFSANVNDMALEVTRNYRTVSGTVALQYLNSVNSDTFTVYGDNWQPGSAALEGFDITPIIRNGQPEYFQVKAVVMMRQAYNTVPLRAWWTRYRNEGLYERTGTTVTIGGSATGYPVINPAGEVAAIVLTNRGRDYTSAPAVTITSGSGSGAAATANVDFDTGQLTSITVTTGGSGYKSKIVRAVDSNQEPVSKPVLLKANGERLFDASEAVFLERPEKLFYLPYNALGLL